MKSAEKREELRLIVYNSHRDLLNCTVSIQRMHQLAAEMAMLPSLILQ